MATKAERDATRRARTDRMSYLVYHVINEPWRFRRNRRYRAEVASLMAESERERAAASKRTRAKGKPDLSKGIGVYRTP